jgi:hypothetical protein
MKDREYELRREISDIITELVLYVDNPWCPDAYIIDDLEERLEEAQAELSTILIDHG